MEKAVDSLKEYYINKINKEIYHIDETLKRDAIIKEHILENYIFLEMCKSNEDGEESSDIGEILDDILEEEAKEEYTQNRIETILHKEIKKELENTVKNIENINLSSSISFINRFVDEMIIQDMADNDIKSIIKNKISNEKDENILVEVLKYYKHLKESRSSK